MHRRTFFTAVLPESLRFEVWKSELATVEFDANAAIAELEFGTLPGTYKDEPEVVVVVVVVGLFGSSERNT